MSTQAMAVVGGAESHRGRQRCQQMLVTSERELLESVRLGDASSFGELYEIHRPAVERLASRLCRDRHEVDDVVSEVFCNTLRAIENGGGPEDETGAYLLRSVRHTVAKLRTRKDTGRATPMANEDLDRRCVDDPDRAGGPATEAWSQVSDRFQQVLWSVEVQGFETSDVADRQRIDASAAAALVYRARRALRRSYLRGSLRTPAAGPECEPTRALLPAFVDGDTETPGAKRVRAHLGVCSSCTAAIDELAAVRTRLGSRHWFMVALVALRSMVSGGIRAALGTIGAAPLVVGAVLGAGGLVLVGSEPDTSSERHLSLTAPLQSSGLASGTPDQTDEPGAGVDPSRSWTPPARAAAAASPSLAEPAASAPAVGVPHDPWGGFEDAVSTATDAAGVSVPATTPTDGVDETVVGAVLEHAGDAVGGIVGVVDETLATVDAVVTQVGGVVADVSSGVGDVLDGTITTLPAPVGDVVDQADATVADVVESAGSTVGSVVDDGVLPVVDSIVPVTPLLPPLLGPLFGN
ncbi:MAG: sigma factor [Ilumatobacteraceae bacterium]